jgi:hypothetical protein
LAGIKRIFTVDLIAKAATTALGLMSALAHAKEEESLRAGVVGRT